MFQLFCSLEKWVGSRVKKVLIVTYQHILPPAKPLTIPHKFLLQTNHPECFKEKGPIIHEQFFLIPDTFLIHLSFAFFFQTKTWHGALCKTLHIQRMNNLQNPLLPEPTGIPHPSLSSFFSRIHIHYFLEAALPRCLLHPPCCCTFHCFLILYINIPSSYTPTFSSPSHSLKWDPPYISSTPLLR